MTTTYSRRTFLQISGYVGACHVALGGLLGRIAEAATRTTSSHGLPVPAGNGRVAFRRSGKGRHVSNAAKQFNANHVFATPQAAQHGAHPGDKSKVVPIVISEQRWEQYFGRGRQVVDLRTLPAAPAAGGRGQARRRRRRS